VNDDHLSLAIYHAETERLKALGEVLAISGISSDLDCGLSRAILEIARRSELRPPPAEPSSAELAATGPGDGVYPTVSTPPRPFPGVKA
jgi:hypothetical protein